MVKSKQIIENLSRKLQVTKRSDLTHSQSTHSAFW